MMPTDQTKPERRSPIRARVVLGLAAISLALGASGASAQSGGSLKDRHDALSKAAQKSNAINPDAANRMTGRANDEAGAKLALSLYRAQDWLQAFTTASGVCNSTHAISPGARAIGWNIVGRVLAEGRTGPANMTGAAAAHRKAILCPRLSDRAVGLQLGLAPAL